MKTAFLFSGELRGFKFAVDKLNKNLLGKFSDCDTYFYIPNPTYKVEDYINPTKICYYDEPNHDIDNIKIETGPNWEKRFVGQWYSLYMCKNMMLESNIAYDLVFRVRPDSNFINEFDISLIDFDKLNVCGWSSWGGLNDRFAVGNMDIMKTYCDFYLNLKEIYGNSERKLMHHIKKNNIDVNIIDFFFERFDLDGTIREQ